jgi:DNA-binding NarL/FixJ family response regulator
MRATGEMANIPRVVWISCPYPAVTLGLARILEGEILRVYSNDDEPPTAGELSLIVLYADGVEELSEGFRRMQTFDLSVPVLVFSTRTDPTLIRTALRMGAQGFLHAGMPPSHIVRALRVASRGELVIPRQFVGSLVEEEGQFTKAGVSALSARQRETLELAADGLSNAQIAQRLFLSEATVKQHLRTAFKILGVTDRKEAGRLIRE